MANVGQGEPKQPTPKQAAAPKQAPPKQELQPHPTMDQLSGVQYCVNSPPPWKKAVLLGFQHYILTLGNTVFISTMTVSQIGGDNAEKARQNVVIYSENCGALAFTRVGSRRVIQISAAFMIFFFVFGKFGAIFASIPWPVAAALYCIFFGCLQQFDNMVSVVLMSHASVAVTIPMILDCTLGRENNENGKDWWEKFAMYGKDVRNDEFYKLPWKLNKFFPAF
ncbi:putative nucleobase-ascorbate transporter 10 [Tanacetum coccineum]|uniref:Nucleobase-ascorbate transporter 10 n=1 Tax=Tanacetum coccineum TaxID=301880 RepID=A0ABQ4X2Y5_9ASTR